MGQQQLLLIVLGVIVVGIAVVVGINVFTASAKQANIDGVTSDLMNLGSMAQAHYRKPLALAGGGNTFTGWAVPLALDTTGNGRYTLTGASGAQSLVLEGLGTELGNNGQPIRVLATVTPNNITTVIDNQ